MGDSRLGLWAPSNTYPLVSDLSSEALSSFKQLGSGKLDNTGPGFLIV